MQRWKQYSALAGLLTLAVAAGYAGFRATGGALPYAKRSASTLQQGVRDSGGSIVDFGRGIVIAGPIRKNGFVLEFAGLVALLVLVGVGLYVYVDRYGGFGDDERPTR